MLKVIGRLIQSGGQPLPGLNVRGWLHGSDGNLVPLGYDTTRRDGSFSLEGATSVVLAAGAPLALRFDVLDGDLALLHQSEHDVSLAAPGAAVDVTVTVPGESRTGGPDAPDTIEGSIGSQG